MDQNLPDRPDYQTLQAKGLTLPEKDFQAITTAILEGINDVKLYLHAEKTPKLIVSDEISAMGFSTHENVINIHTSYLNLTAKNTTTVAYRDQLACFVPDKFFAIFKYLYWLRLFGREAAVHFYQKTGNPMLSIRFPDSFPKILTPKQFLLSDIEVEARTTVDAIATQNKENPIWKNIDAYLSENFSDHYNKSIDDLTLLPNPNLQISLEMESILT